MLGLADVAKEYGFKQVNDLLEKNGFDPDLDLDIEDGEAIKDFKKRIDELLDTCRKKKTSGSKGKPKKASKPPTHSLIKWLKKAHEDKTHLQKADIKDLQKIRRLLNSLLKSVKKNVDL